MLKLTRFTILALYTLLATIPSLLICLIRPFHPNNAWLCARLLNPVGLSFLGFKFHIEGADILQNSRPCIFVCNHQENIDYFTSVKFAPRRTVSIGKTSLAFIPLFGQIYWFSGNILLNRKSRKHSLGIMEKAIHALTHKNTSIWIFPEGTRSKGRGLLPFKKGAFHMAIKAQVPVVPVCIAPYKYNLNKWHSGEVKIKILPPINTKSLSLLDAPQLAKNCHQLMKETINNL